MYLLVSLSGQVSPLISCDLALICTFEFENVSLSLYVGSRKRQLALAFHVWVCLQNTHLFRETQYVEADLNKKLWLWKHEKTTFKSSILDWFFFSTSQTAPKKKFWSTKSPLMQDWVFKLGEIRIWRLEFM